MSTTDTKPDAQVPVRTLQSLASEAYGKQTRPVNQDKRIVDHLPLVKHVVQKIAGHLSHREDTEDLISAGTLGLVKAAAAFDPTRDAEFKTYAYIRIRGAVLDELRSRSLVPPKVLKNIAVMRKAYWRLQGELGHAPDDEQLAAECGISLEQMHRTLAGARRQHFLSIHGFTDDEPALGKLAPLSAEPSPDEQAGRREIKAMLAEALMELPARDRHVMVLYYTEDLTMKEIAAVLKVTEARVSQIHAAALFRLSMKLNPAQVGAGGGAGEGSEQ